MKNKLSHYAAIAIVVCIAGCGEEKISPTFSTAKQDLSSASARRAHIRQLSRGLVAYYPFNGNARDESGNGLDGVVTGATLTSDRWGNAGAAYSFDGDDYIVVADNDLLDFEPADNFTISLWVQVAATQMLDGGINDILRKWSGDAQGYPFSISFLNETAAIPETFLIARYDDGCNHFPNANSAAVARETFHHIVFVKNGTTLSLFVDGVLATSVIDDTSCSTANDSHMTIGARGQLARFFTGKIDDIRIYNRVLSNKEMEWLQGV